MRRGALCLVAVLSALLDASSHANERESHDAVDFEDRIAKLDTEASQLTAEADRIAADIENARTRAKLRGRIALKATRAGLLPLGAGFNALVDHAARIEREKRALTRDAEALYALETRRQAVQQRLDRVRAERGPLSLESEALRSAGVALKEQDERRRAFTRAFESSGDPGRLAIYASDLGDSRPVAMHFQDLRGQLPLPIAGRVEVQRQARGRKGVALMAPQGTGVRVVAAGEIVFADAYGESGLTVVVDHGERFFTVYAGLGQMAVHLGDRVTKGTRVGSVGRDSGGQEGLYFEVRRGQAHLDAAEWLGL